MEYKLEGYNLFLEMMAQIRRNVIYNVYCFTPQKVTPQQGQQAQQQAAQQQQQQQQQNRKKAAAV